MDADCKGGIRIFWSQAYLEWRDIIVAIFPELGDIQAERVRRAIKDSFIDVGWGDPNAVLADLHKPEFKRFVELLQDDPKPDRGLRTLLAHLEELADYGFFDVAESEESLWEIEQPIVIRIHTTQNDNLQKEPQPFRARLHAIHWPYAAPIFTARAPEPRAQIVGARKRGLVVKRHRDGVRFFFINRT
jgi:hypothetical protein